MLAKHFTIPVFIPMEACPFRCIYCDQEKISGHTKIPDTAEIIRTIRGHLETMPENSEIQVGFFGGTFTGLPMEVQEKYLSSVQSFICQGKIKSIRLSTRPDFIDEQILSFLKKQNVETIELGAQSTDDEVLRKSGRGHKAAAIQKAAQQIKEFGFRLGLQMMVGLPGDTIEKTIVTAHKFVTLGAEDVRIYPTLVIKGTPLEKLFIAGKYKPLSLDEAVSWTAAVFPIFESAGINIIRTGLHPSEGLLHRSELVAGPFHVSFKELVLTKLWNDLLANVENPKNSSKIIIRVSPDQINAAVGYTAANRKMLFEKFKNVSFIGDPGLQKRDFNVDYY